MSTTEGTTMAKLISTPQRYTYEGLVVHPIDGTLRSVAGGKVVDIRVEDSRSTITFATVNVHNVIDRQGHPYRY
jgi:hypothetical protein